MSNFDESKGKWRTIRGRRVFIAEGQSLSEAMAKSGKFKREDIRESKTQLRRADRTEKTLQKPDNEKLRRKMTNKGNRYERDVFENRQAEKNRINENAPINEKGIKQVQYVAVLDERTTNICESMNGQIFNINGLNTYYRYANNNDKRLTKYVTEGLKVGENCPALHYNCRSVLYPYK